MLTHTHCYIHKFAHSSSQIHPHKYTHTHTHVHARTHLNKTAQHFTNNPPQHTHTYKNNHTGVWGLPDGHPACVQPTTHPSLSKGSLWHCAILSRSTGWAHPAVDTSASDCSQPACEGAATVSAPISAAALCRVLSKAEAEHRDNGTDRTQCEMAWLVSSHLGIVIDAFGGS